LPAGKSFAVVTASDVAGELVIDNAENTMVVYAYPSSTLKVFLDGELIDEFAPKVPELPPKMTMKD